MFNDHETDDGEGSVAPPASTALRRSSRSAPIGPICRTTAARGSRRNVLAAPSPSSAGQIRRGQGRFSARFRSVISTMMAAYSMPAGSERGCRRNSRPAPSPAEAGRHPCDAVRGPTAKGDALRRQACAVARALGPAGAGRGNHLSQVGRGRPASPHRLRGFKRRQTGEVQREKPARTCETATMCRAQFARRIEWTATPIAPKLRIDRRPSP